MKLSVLVFPAFLAGAMADPLDDIRAKRRLNKEFMDAMHSNPRIKEAQKKNRAQKIRKLHEDLMRNSRKLSSSSSGGSAYQQYTQQASQDYSQYQQQQSSSSQQGQYQQQSYNGQQQQSYNGQQGQYQQQQSSSSQSGQYQQQYNGYQNLYSDVASWNGQYWDFGGEVPFDLTSRAFKYSGCAAIKSYDESRAYETGNPMVIDTYAVFRLCPADKCNKYSLTGCGKNYGEYAVEMKTYLSYVLGYYDDRYASYCDYCEPCDWEYQAKGKSDLQTCYAKMEQAQYQEAQSAAQQAWQTYYNANNGDMSGWNVNNAGYANGNGNANYNGNGNGDQNFKNYNQYYNAAHNYNSYYNNDRTGNGAYYNSNGGSWGGEDYQNYYNYKGSRSSSYGNRKLDGYFDQNGNWVDDSSSYSANSNSGSSANNNQNKNGNWWQRMWSSSSSNNNQNNNADLSTNNQYNSSNVYVDEYGNYVDEYGNYVSQYGNYNNNGQNNQNAENQNNGDSYYGNDDGYSSSNNQYGYWGGDGVWYQSNDNGNNGQGGSKLYKCQDGSYCDECEQKNEKSYLWCDDYTCGDYYTYCSDLYGEQNNFDVSQYLECTAYENDYGMTYYIGPHCGSDHYTISLGVYSDENCLDYIGEDVSLATLLGFQSNDNDLFQLPKECISCDGAEDYAGSIDSGKGRYGQYATAPKTDEEGTVAVCRALYEGSAQCNMHMNNFDTISRYMSAYELDLEKRNCAFIENIIYGAYDETGEIVLMADAFDFNDWRNPRQYKKLRMPPGQAIALAVSILVFMTAAATAIFTHRSLTRMSSPWRPKKMDPEDFGRAPSGIGIARSRSGPGIAPLI